MEDRSAGKPCYLVAQVADSATNLDNLVYHLSVVIPPNWIAYQSRDLGKDADIPGGGLFNNIGLDSLD